MIYERHFLSGCWPEISGEEFEHLKDSISISGLRDSITLYEGQILDGWNRYRACTDTEMSMRFIPFEGTPEEAEQFVRDKHNRRSLTLTQRMACEAKMSTWPGRGGDRFTKNQSAPGALCSAISAASPQNRTELAQKTGGSVRTAQQVINVIKSGNEEAIHAMVQGKLSAKAADAKIKGKDKPPAKPAPVVEPIAEEPEDYTELDAVKESLSAVIEQNDRLNDRLAVAVLDATEEERAAAHTTILALRAELKTERATNRALVLSRDSLMEENKQMKRQMAAQRREIDKLKNNK